jgi:hypothetical protein
MTRTRRSRSARRLFVPAALALDPARRRTASAAAHICHAETKKISAPMAEASAFTYSSVRSRPPSSSKAIAFFFRSSVREQLDEHVVAEAGRDLQPEASPMAGRQAVSRKLTALQFGNARHAPLAHVERQRPGNHHQIARNGSARRDGHTVSCDFGRHGSSFAQ